MKKMLVTALVASSCLTIPALAQTTTSGETTPPAATTTSPAASTTEGSMQASGANAGMQNEGGFITFQEGNQVLGSGLMGANVRGADGENIGTVDDLLLDRDGQIQAVVVGIGGFLGIGEKDVAIANDQLSFVLTQDAAAMNSATTGTAADTKTPASTAQTTAPAAGTAPGAGTTTTPTGTDTAATPANGGTGAASSTAPMSGATTGTAATGNSMMTGTDTAASGNRLSWTGAGIDHIKVNFTRQQLEDAPGFEAAE